MISNSSRSSGNTGLKSEPIRRACFPQIGQISSYNGMLQSSHQKTVAFSTSVRSPQTGQVDVSVFRLHFLQIYLIIFLLSLRCLPNL